MYNGSAASTHTALVLMTEINNLNTYLIMAVTTTLTLHSLWTKSATLSKQSTLH